MRFNPVKILAFNFFMAFLVLIPVIVPYWQQYGLSLEQVYQLQAIFGGVLILLDVPAGYISDVFGRKVILICVGCFNALGFSILAWGHSFSHFVAFEITAAIAMALYSGCDVAMVYDSLDAMGEPQKTQSIYLGRKFFYSQIGETIAAILGGFLAGYSLQLPAYVNAITAWIPLLIAFTLTEPPRKVFASNKHIENIKFAYHHLFVESKILRWLIVFNIIYGFSTYLAVWLYQPFWHQVGIPTSLFGYLWAAANFIIAIFARFALRIESKLSPSRVILIVGLCPIVAYFGLALFTNVYGTLFLIFFAVCRGLNGVILQEAINARVSPLIRATANSFCNLGMRGIFLIFGPIVGRLLDQNGVGTTCAVLAGLYVGLFFVLAIPMLRFRDEFRVSM